MNHNQTLHLGLLKQQREASLQQSSPSLIWRQVLLRALYPLKRKSETIFFGPMVDSNLEDSRMSAENRTLRDGGRGIGLLQNVPN